MRKAYAIELVGHCKMGKKIGSQFLLLRKHRECCRPISLKEVSLLMVDTLSAVDCCILLGRELRVSGCTGVVAN